MLSYRHSFHAGNHADVLKHLCLTGLLRALTQKPKPLCYFETHAGAGHYALNSAYAQKTQEFAAGAGRLLGHSPRDSLLADYMHLAGLDGPMREVADYPGSPAFAQMLLREQDRLQLCELHPTDAALLQRYMRDDSRAHVHERDGFAATRALLPPAQTRGLVLIDPAYETKSDYTDCVEAIVELRKRFRSACITLWYPRLPRDPATPMLRLLAALPATETLNITLDVSEPMGDFGMYGSGLLIIQPPWQLDTQLQSALREVTPLLSPYAKFQIKAAAAT